MRDLPQLKNALVYWLAYKDLLPLIIQRSKSAKVQENRQKDMIIAYNQIAQIKKEIKKLNQQTPP